MSKNIGLLDAGDGVFVIDNWVLGGTIWWNFQGRVQFPTGGKHLVWARERFLVEGQQIWCDSRADGYSPDERKCIDAA